MNEGLSHGRAEERAALSFSIAIHIYAARKQRSNQEHRKLPHKAQVPQNWFEQPAQHFTPTSTL